MTGTSFLYAELHGDSSRTLGFRYLLQCGRIIEGVDISKLGKETDKPGDERRARLSHLSAPNVAPR